MPSVHTVAYLDNRSRWQSHAQQGFAIGTSPQQNSTRILQRITLPESLQSVLLGVCEIFIIHYHNANASPTGRGPERMRLQADMETRERSRHSERSNPDPNEGTRQIRKQGKGTMVHGRQKRQMFPPFLLLPSKKQNVPTIEWTTDNKATVVVHVLGA